MQHSLHANYQESFSTLDEQVSSPAMENSNTDTGRKMGGSLSSQKQLPAAAQRSGDIKEEHSYTTAEAGLGPHLRAEHTADSKSSTSYRLSHLGCDNKAPQAGKPAATAIYFCTLHGAGRFCVY